MCLLKGRLSSTSENYKATRVIQTRLKNNTNIQKRNTKQTKQKQQIHQQSENNIKKCRKKQKKRIL